MSLLHAIRMFLSGPPDPPRETKDANVLHIWEDYWGIHVAIDKGRLHGIKSSDTFFIVRPARKCVVTNPDTKEVLTTYYENAFKVWAECVHDTWTDCRVSDSDKILARQTQSTGSLAVFQYNFDRQLSRKTWPALRLP